MHLHTTERVENGTEVVVLPKDEFLSLQEKAEDYEDLLDLEEAIRKNADDPGVPYQEFRKTLGL
jgi:PHD/YefM family antitoxin component YafN of YafNO toxin-antitoxin module